jgi:feruloyl esterase
LAIALTAANTAFAQSLSFGAWQSSTLPDAPQIQPRQACADLWALTGLDVTVVSATVVAATPDTQEHCRVVGLIQPEVRFEVLLPARWNGRLYMFGNGGYAGEALDNPGRVSTGRRAVARGFAVAQTNTGHDAVTEPLGSFAVNPQKFLDYAYRAVHVTALTAKTIVQRYYEAPAAKSYFDGCSTGGRQGLMSAQRFPDDFDGIVVGAPILNFVDTMVSYVDTQRALTRSPLTPAHLTRLSEAVTAKCDAVDGVRDGVIDDPRRCTFTPSTDLPACGSAAANATCFTREQVRTVEDIFDGVSRQGRTVFPGWPLGTEAVAPLASGEPRSAWQPWFVSAPPTPRAIQASFGETFLRYMGFGKPAPDYDWLSFDVEADFDKLQAARATLNATDPDLSRFKARGGKIVSYFGWADPALNPLMSVQYYEQVTKAVPGTTDFYRMFMVPGMFHCGGGVGVNTFDPFTTLVRWVERGEAPAMIAASRVVDGKSIRTRPLCAYPEVARYKGSGSADDAANFSCGR